MAQRLMALNAAPSCWLSPTAGLLRPIELRGTNCWPSKVQKLVCHPYLGYWSATADMSDPAVQRVVEQDLQTEQAVVAALPDWLQANPDIEWKTGGRKNIEQCSDVTAQRNITEPLSTRVCPPSFVGRS